MQSLEEMVRIRGFQNEAIRSASERLKGHLAVALCGDYQESCRCTEFLNSPDDFQAEKLGDVEIDDSHIRPQPLQHVQRRNAIGALAGDLEAAVGLAKPGDPFPDHR